MELIGSRLLFSKKTKLIVLPRWATFVLEFQKNVFEVAFEVISPYFSTFSVNYQNFRKNNVTKL